MREPAGAGLFHDKKQMQSDKWLIFADKFRHRR